MVIPTGVADLNEAEPRFYGGRRIWKAVNLAKQPLPFTASVQCNGAEDHEIAGLQNRSGFSRNRLRQLVVSCKSWTCVT